MRLSGEVYDAFPRAVCGLDLFHLGYPVESLPKIVLRMHPRISQIDGKLRGGLVKIRTAIQIASTNSNSGTAREPSFVPSGEAYGWAACYDLRDRSTVLLQLKAGLDTSAAANAAWRIA
jgi:hypothetical protein